LPPALGGTSVTIDGKPAFVYYVSQTQLNIIVPDDVTIGGLGVQVTTAAGSSSMFTAAKESFAPALFLFTTRYPAAVHADGTYLGPPNLLAGVTTVPAKPNEIILLFGTGFGATNPAVLAGQLVTNAAPLAVAVTATVGGVPAPVLGFLIDPGSYQFNLTVPNLPDGDAALSLSIAGMSTQTGIFLSIAH
jgi:uncharacterized protein (TIGR03437 family)